MARYKVPFSDERFTSEEKEAVKSVLDSGWASKGELCDAFEADLSRYLGSNVCLVNTGSAALMVSLLANEVKAGDTVLVPDFTFVATASVPAILGCKIVPVDADPKTFNWNTRGIRPNPEATISGRIGAIGTDVAGLPFGKFFNDGDYIPIEDGAEALGAEVSGHKIGSDKWLTTFSFQATKQLSTVEGGAIASKDEELIDKCRRIADYGRTETRYLHSELGMNFRMTDLQAALGLSRLRNLDTSLRRRQAIAERYAKSLRGLLTPQRQPEYVSRHAWWTWIGLASSHEERDVLLKFLNDSGIDAREPWRPVHLQPRFDFDHLDKTQESFNSTHIWKNGIMLPISNTMTDEQVEFVISAALA